MRIYKIKKQEKTAQDFNGYFSGSIPEYGAQFLGTGSVDSSQIQGVFGKVNDAIALVNRFDSSLLQNISFIFNFSKGGAYGVYVPALDRVIKTQALKKRLEGMGYSIEVDDQGLLTAISPDEDKSQEQIQQDIDRLYEDLESKGGTAFGINMNDVIQASQQDAMTSESEDPDIWQWMAMLHLGSTIVHEAVHAQGHEGEGESEAAEASFMAQALPMVNEEYKSSLVSQNKEEMYAPLSITGNKRSAGSNTWYKEAQMSHYVPQAFMGNATGSDLSGRFPIGPQSEQGLAGWSMMAQEDQNVAIEQRLGRQFMSPLPPDLSQENDSYEEQLRKFTRDDEKLDPNASMEELLSETHDANLAYETLEGLLDDKRVKPLILPIAKEPTIEKESSINKKATLFGWFNNLEISDGNTIPGLSDRVMAWDDRDESFTGTEKDIRSQPRYNPRYDIKGFYYRYIEPRFKPALWDDPNEQSSGIAPAKRFAANVEMDTDFLTVLGIFKKIKAKLDSKAIMGTRLIMTDDAIPLIAKALGQEYQIGIYCLGSIGKESVYSVWIYSSEVSEEKIEKAERFFNGEEEDSSEVDELIGYSSQKETVIKEIIDNVNNICDEYEIKDFYLVGGSVRDIVIGNKLSNIEDLDFSAMWPSQSIKVGWLLVERLGVLNTDFHHKTMTLSFEYKGVKTEFRGSFTPIEIKDQLKVKNIKTTPFNIDIFNRDFTINMLALNISDGQFHDPSGVAKKDIQEERIMTFLDPEFVCRKNPLIIMRALKLKLKYGFDIDSQLEIAMITNVPLLFKQYSNEKLIIARENVERENRKEAEILFKEYGLEKIKEI